MRGLVVALLAIPAASFVVRSPVQMSAVQEPKTKASATSGEASQDPLLLRAARGEVCSCQIQLHLWAILPSRVQIQRRVQPEGLGAGARRSFCLQQQHMFPED